MNQRRGPLLRLGGWAVGLMLSPSDLAMQEAYLHPTDEMSNEWPSTIICLTSVLTHVGSTWVLSGFQ